MKANTPRQQRISGCGLWCDRILLSAGTHKSETPIQPRRPQNPEYLVPPLRQCILPHRIQCRDQAVSQKTDRRMIAQHTDNGAISFNCCRLIHVLKSVFLSSVLADFSAGRHLLLRNHQGQVAICVFCAEEHALRQNTGQFCRL